MRGNANCSRKNKSREKNRNKKDKNTEDSNGVDLEVQNTEIKIIKLKKMRQDIEEIREELNMLIRTLDYPIENNEVIKLSQQLDVLLVEYIKSQAGR